MRASAIGVLAWVAMSGAALAQSQQPLPAGRGYVEGTAQSAFGNVTSQSFGGEFGFTVLPQAQVFVDAGQVRDAAPAALGAGAQLVAGYLSQTQAGVGFSAKQPVTFGVAGLRYAIAVSASRLEPYVLGGGGIARVQRQATFTVGGTDVTANMSQYGIQLGTDLSGSETRPMLSLGGGVVWPAWERLVVDLQYRYGRVFASDRGLNINRAGIGVGVRF